MQVHNLALIYRWNAPAAAPGARGVDVLRRHGLERPVIVEMAGELLPLDGNVADLTGFDTVEEARERQWLRAPPVSRALKKVEEDEEEQHDEDPQCCVPAEVHDF